MFKVVLTIYAYAIINLIHQFTYNGEYLYESCVAVIAILSYYIAVFLTSLHGYPKDKIIRAYKYPFYDGIVILFNMIFKPKTK